MRIGALPRESGGGRSHSMNNGTLFLISTPIGNLADLSRRALSTLEAVSVVYAEDTRRSRTLLRHYGLHTPLRSLHEHNESSRIDEILGRLAAGEDCALVSDAGTPTVSDPGVRLVDAVAEAQMRVEPIPGPSAVTAALAVSGLGADRFLFLGFAPRRGRGRGEWMTQAILSPHTVVAFEAPGRLADLLAEWRTEGAGDRRCVVCRELTKLHEEIRYGTVDTLADYYLENSARGELTVVLAGQGVSPRDDAVDEKEAMRIAVELAAQGRSTREISRRLRGEFGMTRNRAYELALEAAEGK